MHRRSIILAAWVTLGLWLGACSPSPILTAAPSATFAPSITTLPQISTSMPTATPSPSPHPPEETSTPVFTATPPSASTSESWETYSDPDLHIQFRYPADWRAETPQRLSGSDGFVELSLVDFLNTEFYVMPTLCVLEANSDQTEVYGANPLIDVWQGYDAERQTTVGWGCTVTPGDDLSKDGLKQAVLFARYPPSLMHNQLLVLRADSAHFADILSTLLFQDYVLPTPSGESYDSPPCPGAMDGLSQVALRTGSLVITETSIADDSCDPADRYFGFQAPLKEVRARTGFDDVYPLGLRGQAAADNLALAPFGYRLVEHAPDAASPSITFDLYHGEQLQLTGLTRMGQVSVNADGDDFILWVQDNADNNPPVEVRNGQTRSIKNPFGGFNTAWVGADILSFDYTDGPLFPPRQVNIARNGQVVDTLVIAPAGAAGISVAGFWSWDGHWLLETDGVLVQDGKLMNPVLGYAEIFEWNLMNGEPFYLFQKNTRYGIHYAGQELPLRYDDIIHGPLCCDASVYNINASPNEVWFFALRDSVWYLVHILAS